MISLIKKTTIYGVRMANSKKIYTIADLEKKTGEILIGVKKSVIIEKDVVLTKLQKEAISFADKQGILDKKYLITVPEMDKNDEIPVF